MAKIPMVTATSTRVKPEAGLARRTNIRRSW
jgi:hypothetical protein